MQSCGSHGQKKKKPIRHDVSRTGVENLILSGRNSHSNVTAAHRYAEALESGLQSPDMSQMGVVV